MTTSPAEISYGYTSNPGAALTRVVLTDTGMAKRLVWDAGARTWQTFFQGPRDVCDAYGKWQVRGVRAVRRRRGVDVVLQLSHGVQPRVAAGVVLEGYLRRMQAECEAGLCQ